LDYRCGWLSTVITLNQKVLNARLSTQFLHDSLFKIPVNANKAWNSGLLARVRHKAHMVGARQLKAQD